MKFFVISKKIIINQIACFLALSLSIQLLSCKNDKKDESVKELTKIEIWYIPSHTEAGEPPADWFFYEKVRNELGIDLVLKALPPDNVEFEKIIMEASKKNALPDMFRCTHSMMIELAKENKITTVDKMFQYMPIRCRDIHTPEARKAGQIDYLTFAITYPTSTSSLPKNEGILIRKDWLDNLGLSIPKTIDDFYNVMEAFTYNDPDGNGKNDTYGYGAFIETKNLEEGLGTRFSPILGAYGVCGTFNYTPKNEHLNIRSFDYYEAIKFIKKMVSTKVIDPNWSGYKKDDFRNAWKSGRFGIMREQFAAFSLKSNYTQFDEKFPEGEWIVIDPPVGPKGKSAVGVNSRSWNYLVVNRRTSELEKTKKLAQLLEWMYTNAYNDLWYGEKDVNYTITPNGKISDEVPDESLSFTSPNTRNLLQLSWLVDHNSKKDMLERYPIWTTKNGKTMNSIAILEKMQSANWIEGFNVDKMNQRLQKLYKEGIMDFVMGKRNLTKENWIMFIRELDSCGLAEWERNNLDKARENGFISN